MDLFHLRRHERVASFLQGLTFPECADLLEFSLYLLGSWYASASRLSISSISAISTHSIFGENWRRFRQGRVIADDEVIWLDVNGHFLKRPPEGHATASHDRQLFVVAIYLCEILARSIQMEDFVESILSLAFAVVQSDSTPYVCRETVTLRFRFPLIHQVVAWTRNGLERIWPAKLHIFSGGQVVTRQDIDSRWTILSSFE